MLSLLTACAYGDKASSSKLKSFSVDAYKGLYLGDLLNEPQTIKSPSVALQVLNKDWYTGIEVKNENKSEEPILVKNCTEFFKAVEQGKEPIKEFERSAYFEFSVMCKAAKEFALAKPAAISFMGQFEFNDTLPKRLPKQFSFLMSMTEYTAMLNNKKRAYWGDVNKITDVVSVTAESAIYKQQGSQQELVLVAKADFNEDNKEDLLIISKDSVSGGSFMSIRLFLITRLAIDGEYVLLKEYSAN